MPDAIGHYRVVRQIGRGGMGIVYEAVDERLQRAVALKTIAPSNDAGLRERFLRERAVGSGLACVRALETSPHFDGLRQTPRFGPLVEAARAARAAASRAFADADGHRILGLTLV